MNGFNLLEASDIKLGGSTITALYYGLTKLWPTAIDYSKEYFTIESLADNNTITFIKYETEDTPTKTIYWSSDKTTWNSVSSSVEGTTIKTLSNNEKIYIKGSNDTYASSDSEYNYFSSTGDFNVSGNIMSLIYGDNFIGQTTLPSYDYIFYGIFCISNVVDASNLILPATTLTQYCYGEMFSTCTSLTTSPELPATTLADGCYNYMFGGCTSLTTAPELPATTLANECYYQMFSGCTSLTTAPELPATTLAYGCYNNMFNGCTSLTTAPELPATTLTQYCYKYMFQNCTSLTTAPELPATTLAGNCYNSMFRGCTSLSSIKCLATDISATNCTQNWVNGVASNGTFTKTPNMTSWTTGVNGIPTGWTVKELINPTEEYLTIESLADNNVIGFKTSKSSLTKTIQVSTDKTNWTSYTSRTLGITLTTLNTGDKLYVKGSNNQYGTSSTEYNYFTSTGQFNVFGNIMSLIYGDNFIGKTTLSSTYTFCRIFTSSKVVDASNLILPATTLAQNCYREMFYSCTSLTTAPELPARTLTNYCYLGMFNGCTSLTTTPALPATTLATSCYHTMFKGCTSLTTAPSVLPARTLKQACYMSMFYGCTSLTNAPELPATTLTQTCYEYMFQGCTSLISIKCLATNISATDCTKNWLVGVAASGTFTKAASMSGWTTGASGIPTGWTVQTASS